MLAGSSGNCKGLETLLVAEVHTSLFCLPLGSPAYSLRYFLINHQQIKNWHILWLLLFYPWGWAANAAIPIPLVARQDLARWILLKAEPDPLELVFCLWRRNQKQQVLSCDPGSSCCFLQLGPGSKLWTPPGKLGTPLPSGVTWISAH